jgi:hypothetical protein
MRQLAEVGQLTAANSAKRQGRRDRHALAHANGTNQGFCYDRTQQPTIDFLIVDICSVA